MRGREARLGQRNTTPWLLATAEDGRWPTVEGGQSSLLTRLAQRHIDLVLAVIADEAVTGQARFAVLHLLKPLTTLLRPPVAVRMDRQAPGADVEVALSGLAHERLRVGAL